jgi:hypothetical protein
MSIKTPSTKINLINNRIKYGTDGGINVDSNALVVNASTGRVGINTTAITSLLDISGSIKSSGIADYSNSTGNNTQILTNINREDLWSYPQYNFNGANMFPSFPFSQSVIPNDVSVTAIQSTPFAKYFGGCLAPNGNIYLAPCPFIYDPAIHSSIWTPNIGIFNPYTKVLDQTTFSVNKIPDLSGKFFWGSVCGPNGKVYGIPFSAPFIYIINTFNNTIDINKISGLTSTNSYRSGVLAPNGKIYCAPSNFTYPIGVIDTSNDTFYTIPVPQPVPGNGGFGGYYRGALGSNGCVYLAPARGSGGEPLKIDPTTDTVTHLSGFNLSNLFGAVTGKDGNVYFTPYGETRMMRVNVSNDTPTNVTARPYQSNGMALGGDGLIYIFPEDLNQTSLAALNTDTSSIIVMPNALIAAGTINGARPGAILGPDGVLYTVPSIWGAISTIKTGIPNLPNWMIAPSFNKL